MLQLLQSINTLDANTANSKAGKKVAEKRLTPLECTEKKESKIYAKLSYFPKEIEIEALLLSENVAAMQSTDYVYKVLNSLLDQHKNLISSIPEEEYTYHQPFDETSFKFKIINQQVFRNKRDLICLPEDCINKVCSFKLRVMPYDVSKNSNRNIGLVIKVSKIKATKY